MVFAQRFAIAALAVLASASACAGGEASGHGVHAGRACLDQKERRAESEAGRVIQLATAMRVAKSRMPGTVVQARLCHGHDGLVYVLTVLGHDGKVARLTVDAVKGTLVGGL